MARDGETRSRFLRVYDCLKDELLRDPLFDHTEETRRRVEEMLDYNVPRGKLNRGLAIVETYRLLKEGDELSEEEIFLACVLGWCNEWLQACLLILDDIMDNSHTRRGQLCWYKLPEVGLQTSLGQMLDLIVTHEGEKDLSNYTMAVYRRIVQYKTSYYSFYLPVACALLLAGENLDDFIDVKNILVEMGIYFQVQDDYLDCFGDPKVMGKIGTDIEDYKCSWLVVQALERANDNQRRVLYENYGKSDSVSVAKVKNIYEELNLQDVFFKYGLASYEHLISSIEAQPNAAVREVLEWFLRKIHCRQK
ncbi:farnesyl pyrophosphate synthase-like isoform X3 [Ananas comosus]|uniref:Farnesyl pyrophosphate synthase-like isoform X3 n=1 Tax=Ananas comosus TaxID=4615 RepID=A0A6P5EQR2_ANACO|nr:farnesyl pyrophosphate synthase-like isoform X3 [Ananas comosus]